MRYAMVNEHGINEGVLEMDERAARAHPMPSGWRLMPVTLEEHDALGHLGYAARHDAQRGWHLLPDGYVRQWHRARGHRWFTVMIEHDRHRSLVKALHESSMLGCLARPGSEDLTVPAPPPCVRHYPVPTLEIRPGLVIREQTEEESIDLAGHVVRSGMFDEHADLGRLRTAVWHDDPYSWPITILWRNEVLGYETYHFMESKPGVVRVGFNVRLRRDRPYQFWLRVFKPFFEHLKGLDIDTIESRVRADRPHYINGLIDTYGAERVNGDNLGVNLRYDVERAIGAAQDWPEMTTAGPGWEFRRGELRVWEATPEELDALGGRLPGLWRTVSGMERAAQILDDWRNLDAGSVLLGELAGELRYARILRRRAQGVAALAVLLPMWKDPEQTDFAEGIRAWCQAVGYSRITTFVPANQYATDVMQRHHANIGLRVVAMHDFGPEPMYEMEGDV